MLTVVLSAALNTAWSAVAAHFSKAMDFILNTNLADLPLGRNEISGDDVFANVMEVNPRTKDEVPIEIHRKYIDIQVPITGDEVMGYTSIDELPAGEYSDENDVTLYPVGMLAKDYFNVKRSMFTIFFPQDGHAPAVTPVKVKKVIVKVAI
ncbi:MAG: YhcH/YjgK/YiaL family protein [Bacteroidaceae bacterium]|nr:YhcH/YjgK/YiaL family protein [Bacteroidaceae bacterium]